VCWAFLGLISGKGVYDLSEALLRRESNGYSVPGVEQSHTISFIPGTSEPKGRIYRVPTPR